MPGDFSRKTFNKQKHYSGVLMQQGRVQLDADWNEQLDIAQHRTGTETIDVIGRCGVPKQGGFFNITAAANGSDLIIAPGHIYVGGLLCELQSSTPAPSYFRQPYYPNSDKTYFTNPGSSPPQSPPQSPPAAASTLKDGTYLVYVDAWQREQNYLDDRRLQEVALGEADTAARLQNVWQVKLLSVADAAGTCKTTFKEWQDLQLPPTGKLNVQTSKVEDPQNPCLLPPQAGYKRLENQLYRVEVQKGGSNRAATTFKWSRDNASVETKIEKIAGSVVTVSSIGRDEVLGFKSGQWVELTDEESNLKLAPKPLLKILSVDAAKREITLDTPAIVAGSAIKLRRWDQEGAGANGMMATAGWVDLEDGIQVFFSEGSYRSGDYWLIPARTATAEVEWPPYDLPNLAPEPQAPQGIKHHYCKLALLQVAAGVITVQDCRPLFPSLTEICAEDICFDNRACNFEEASNVQEALDLLCAANDLRSHHKYLHGFGVVCGLKLRCRATRTGVTIEKGRALDCEGAWIEIKTQNGLVYDLVEDAKKNQLLDEKGDGTVCLSIARGANRTVAISIEQYVPRNFWDTVLEGTLLKDFYEECIENLFQFLKQQFPFPLTDEAPVPVGQRRLTAFLNLFAQLVNSASGPYGFISGGKEEANNQPTEDGLLRRFYNDLKAQVASETFCAMFDNDRPFPDYKIDAGLGTVFGPALKFHHRLRLHPSGKVGYTCGGGNRVYVYDLVTNELAHTLSFPAAANITVQDIALSEKGDELYAVGILNNQDSVFAVAAVNDKGDFTWGATSFVAGIKFVTLRTGPANKLFGIGKARGFYAINGVGSAAFAAQQIMEFNATGLMTITARGQVVAANADAAVGTETDTFSFLRIFLANGNGDTGKIALSGDDGLNDLLMHNDMVFATGNSVTGQRILGGFNVTDGAPQTTQEVLNETSAVRLGAYAGERSGDFLLLAIADRFKVTRVRITGEKLEQDMRFRIPVQLFPMSVAVAGQTQKAYVLNMMANTLTTINLPLVFDNQNVPDYTSDPPAELAAYRDDAIAAYRDVLSHLVQYLKDCFCDKFLVDCPECTEKDKVYLGCVEVRNGQVYHICNFSGRTYVKSFRTVEYWLSTIPVLPIVKEAFTKLCCTVFDDRRNQSINNKP